MMKLIRNRMAVTMMGLLLTVSTPAQEKDKKPERGQKETDRGMREKDKDKGRDNDRRNSDRDNKGKDGRKKPDF